MARIFISYRRSDSASIAGRIYDRLCARYQRHNVFKDVDAMPAGVNFPAYIAAALRQCEVALVFIGRDWLGARADGGLPQIANPDDWVRVEVEQALAAHHVVLPVLVEGAHMPLAADLPDTLRPLLAINALRVRDDPDFARDMEHVYAAIDRAAAAPRPSAPGSGPAPAPDAPRASSALAPVTPRPLPTPSKPDAAPSPVQPPPLPAQAPVTPRVVPVTAAPGPAPAPRSNQAGPAAVMPSMSPLPPPPAAAAPRQPSGPPRTGRRRPRSLILVGAAAVLVVATIAGLLAGRPLIAALASFHVARAPGSVIEYRVPPLNPDNNTLVHIDDITSGPDGAFWFTYYVGAFSGSDNPQASAIWRITTSGILKEFALPDKADDPLGITRGPDGNLWFTETQTNRIGRITPAGALIEYPLGGSGTSKQPGEIIAGPDDALWFTETNAHTIGRITISGTITEFPLPVGSGHSNYPQAITAGPDGALWFTTGNLTTGAGDEAIGRITTDGTVTYFRTETSFSTSEDPTYPADITAGPDDALWFTEVGGSRIGRITTDGQVTEFTLTAHRTADYSITAGPDDALWFTGDNDRNQDSSNVGSITTSGAVTDFPVSPGTFSSEPDPITAGPNNTLWFVQNPQLPGIAAIANLEA